MQDFILYGSGGHARVLRDLIELQGDRVVAVYDEENEYDNSSNLNALLVIAIGNNEVRARIAQEVSHKFGTLIHPNAYIAKDVKIGEGSVILAHAVLQANSCIGKHVIINANVVVDHDAFVDDFCSTYPGVYISATARVPKLLKLNAHETFSAH